MATRENDRYDTILNKNVAIRYALYQTTPWQSRLTKAAVIRYASCILGDTTD